MIFNGWKLLIIQCGNLVYNGVHFWNKNNRSRGLYFVWIPNKD